MIISVNEFIDKDPSLLYEHISTELSKGVRLVINFKFIEKITHEFLEETIGKVLDDYNFQNIGNKVNFINVDSGIKEMLSKLVEEKMK